MLNALRRKARQVIHDPALRAWLTGRTLGRWPREPSFTPHQPSYVTDQLPLADETPAPPMLFDACERRDLSGPITLDLAGTDITLTPSYGIDLMNRPFDDTEVLLALHRFSWLPLHGAKSNSSWVTALWQAWVAAHGTPDDGWAWHPYTAAERAINLLDFGRVHGLPEPVADTTHLLAAHAPVIAARLEYFGDHHTSNHLANNGRGLYRLGLDLGLLKAADLGRDILLNEGKRLFGPSGMLREGSSHYHLLLTRNYLDTWLAAVRHDRPESEDLKQIAVRSIAVAKALMLPDGMPLVGDISPDCPPAFLFNGWMRVLTPEDHTRCRDLVDTTPKADPEALVSDGWLIGEWHDWSGLWHTAPKGWSHMPGHGHQDTGSFELCYQGQRIVIDPGRGQYGESGDAAFYRSADAHSGLQIDDEDPYPPNKPYYGDLFRETFGGPAPTLQYNTNGARLAFEGYRRLRGVGTVERTWTFDGPRCVLSDVVDGRGTRAVTRRLVTPIEPKVAGDNLRLGPVTVAYSGSLPAIRPITLWSAYGRGVQGWALESKSREPLPYSGTITIEAA